MTAIQKQQRAAATSKLRDAVYHLVQCWDALGNIEALMGEEIPARALDGVAGKLNEPSEAYVFAPRSAITTSDLDYVLRCARRIRKNG